jgi:N-methylhydantoinase A
VKYEGHVGGMPLQTTWVDVRSIGAGGGSVAFEQDGLLHVGPRSAGADPGPVCYSRGGAEPTVTDAAAALGMLAFGDLAGGVQLDIASARRAVAELGEHLGLDVDRTAQGVMEITAVTMANAIRAILQEVGEDPRAAALLAFGGAGPLFATLLARELDIRTVVVPNYAGNFSAWGLLLQDLTRAAARTVVAPLSPEGLAAASEIVRALQADLAARAVEHRAIGAQERWAVALDLRYQGQEYFLTVEVPFSENGITADPESVKTSFERDYEKRYGHILHSPLEIVAARVMTTVPLPKTNLLRAPSSGTNNGGHRTVDAFSFVRGARVPFAVMPRQDLASGTTVDGPLIIVEETATTYVDEGFRVDVHPSGALLITEGKASA